MVLTKVEIPIDIKRGNSGIWLITSPLIKGLLVTGTTDQEAIDAVPRAVLDLGRALPLVEEANG